MPNNPLAFNAAKNPAGSTAPVLVDAQGNVQAGGQTPGLASTTLNVSASTVIKASAGQVFCLNVTTAGSTTGSLHDCATTGAAGAANLVFTVPDTVGNYRVDFPFATGIVYVPGTGQVAALAWQ